MLTCWFPSPWCWLQEGRSHGPGAADTPGGQGQPCCGICRLGKAESGRWREPCPRVLSFAVGRRLGGILLELWKVEAVRTHTHAHARTCSARGDRPLPCEGAEGAIMPPHLGVASSLLPLAPLSSLLNDAWGKLQRPSLALNLRTESEVLTWSTSYGG